MERVAGFHIDTTCVVPSLIDYKHLRWIIVAIEDDRFPCSGNRSTSRMHFIKELISGYTAGAIHCVYASHLTYLVNFG